MGKGGDRLKAHRKMIDDAKQARTIGVHSDAGETRKGLKLSLLSIYHQLGALDGSYPPRPYAEIGNADSRSKVAGIMRNGARNGDLVSALDVAASAMVGAQKSVIDEVTRLEKNAESVIAKKGKNHPLFENGALRNAISFKRV